jgi:hypothetical protein
MFPAKGLFVCDIEILLALIKTLIEEEGDTDKYNLAKDFSRLGFHIPGDNPVAQRQSLWHLMDWSTTHDAKQLAHFVARVISAIIRAKNLTADLYSANEKAEANLQQILDEDYCLENNGLSGYIPGYGAREKMKNIQNLFKWVRQDVCFCDFRERNYVAFVSSDRLESLLQISLGTF